MAKIKYMGTSDVRVFKKGEDFGGQLADPLTKDVRFTPKNNHVVDTEEAGLSDEAVALILGLEGVMYQVPTATTEDDPSQDTAKTIKEFKDVTDLKTIPPSLHQSTFLGIKERVANEDAVKAPSSEGDEGQPPAGANANLTDGGTAAPAGGSTTPTTGGTTRAPRGGGSTATTTP